MKNAIIFLYLMVLSCSASELKEERGNMKLAINIVGEYQSEGDIYYIAELHLDKDETFEYFGETCFGEFYTKGTWSKTGNIVSLQSDNAFKEEVSRFDDICYDSCSINPMNKYPKSGEIEIKVSSPTNKNFYIDNWEFTISNNQLYKSKTGGNGIKFIKNE